MRSIFKRSGARPISRLVPTAPSTHHHIDGEGATRLEVLQPTQHRKDLVLPDLHRDQLPNENRNLDGEGMGEAKPFRPVLQGEPVLLLTLSHTDFGVIPQSRAALGHAVFIFTQLRNQQLFTNRPAGRESSWGCKGGR